METCCAMLDSDNLERVKGEVEIKIHEAAEEYDALLMHSKELKEEIAALRKESEDRKQKEEAQTQMEEIKQIVGNPKRDREEVQAAGKAADENPRVFNAFKKRKVAKN
jgi:uncharacterized protein YydD (DUF2326 family)